MIVRSLKSIIEKNTTIKIRILNGDVMSEIIKCPKCDSEIRIIKESNWDNLDTYLYPVCDNCKWTTKRSLL